MSLPLEPENLDSIENAELDFIKSQLRVLLENQRQMIYTVLAIIQAIPDFESKDSVMNSLMMQLTSLEVTFGEFSEDSIGI